MIATCRHWPVSLAYVLLFECCPDAAPAKDDDLLYKLNMCHWSCGLKGSKGCLPFQIKPC